MTTKSHYCLGLFLLRHGVHCCTRPERYAFLLGCIEPDLNVVTYIKGSACGQRLRGHNYPNMCLTVKRLFEKLEGRETERLLFHYRAGKLTHYLTDAFTFPHNPEFTGSLREHTDYEAALEAAFLERLCNAAPPYPIRARGELYQYFLTKHEVYRRERAGADADIYFTLRVVPVIVQSLYAAAPVSYKGNRRESGHESPAGI